MKNKNHILEQLNVIAQKGVPDKQVLALIFLVNKYASSFKNEIIGLNEKNVGNHINSLYSIISKY